MKPTEKETRLWTTIGALLHQAQKDTRATELNLNEARVKIGELGKLYSEPCQQCTELEARVRELEANQRAARTCCFFHRTGGSSSVDCRDEL